MRDEQNDSRNCTFEGHHIGAESSNNAALPAISSKSSNILCTTQDGEESHNFQKLTTKQSDSRDYQFEDNVNGSSSANLHTLSNESANILPPISHDSANPFSKKNESYDECRRRMIYDEKVVLDSESSFIQSSYESPILGEQNPFVEEIICLSPRAATSTSKPKGARPVSLPLQHISVPASGRHCMPQAPPHNVMLDGVRRNRARVPGMQMQPRYRRSCTPAAQHQGHTTADPAQKTVQPPPLEQARSQTDPARNLLGTPSIGAPDTARAGLIAAARAAEMR